MPNYSWKGRTRAGKTQEGVLVAESKDAVVASLRKQQIIVTAVTEKGKEFALPKLGGGISRKEIAIFTRQFSVMIDAGLPLVQCLEILGSQQNNRTFQKILFQVRQDVESGATLADALRKHPAAFDDLYSNMVAAGEAGGILDTILQRLSVYIEKIVKLRAAIRSALVYPVARLGRSYVADLPKGQRALGSASTPDPAAGWVVLCDQLFREGIGADCGGPAEDAFAAAYGLTDPPIDRIKAAPTRWVSIYLPPPT